MSNSSNESTIKTYTLCDRHAIRMIEVAPGRFECPVCAQSAGTRRRYRR
ncbi:MAG: hypothetical protein ABSF83_10295 [Nitrososphaerales archaeon]|jgi:hypothetical protein